MQVCVGWRLAISIWRSNNAGRIFDTLLQQAVDNGLEITNVENNRCKTLSSQFTFKECKNCLALAWYWKLPLCWVFFFFVSAHCVIKTLCLVALQGFSLRRIWCASSARKPFPCCLEVSWCWVISGFSDRVHSELMTSLACYVSDCADTWMVKSRVC